MGWTIGSVAYDGGGLQVRAGEASTPGHRSTGAWAAGGARPGRSPNRCETFTSCVGGVHVALCSLVADHFVYASQKVLVVADYAWDEELQPLPSSRCRMGTATASRTRTTTVPPCRTPTRPTPTGIASGTRATPMSARHAAASPDDHLDDHQHHHDDERPARAGGALRETLRKAVETAACIRTRCAGRAGAEGRHACVETCRGIGGCAPIGTLAYVWNECRSDARGSTLRRELRIRRGNCAPVTVMTLDSGDPKPDPVGLCMLYGSSRNGSAATLTGGFERLAVSPDGSGVVFEVTNKQVVPLFGGFSPSRSRRGSSSCARMARGSGGSRPPAATPTSSSVSGFV